METVWDFFNIIEPKETGTVCDFVHSYPKTIFTLDL